MAVAAKNFGLSKFWPSQTYQAPVFSVPFVPCRRSDFFTKANVYSV